jgi:hypothetical protein
MIKYGIDPTELQELSTDETGIILYKTDIPTHKQVPTIDKKKKKIVYPLKRSTVGDIPK